MTHNIYYTSHKWMMNGDSLDLFALNVPTCFDSVTSSLVKNTSHSAHRSFEPTKEGSHPHFHT